MMRPAASDQRGSTLLETVIVVAVIATLSGVVVESLLGLARTQRVNERRAELLTIAERTMQGILADGGSAFRVYVDDDYGRALLGLLEAGPAARLRDARLPKGTVRGVFEPDPAASFETGNLLLIGRSLRPRLVPVEAVGSGTGARIDLLQLVLYHLTRVEDRLEIERWASEPIARADDIAALTDPVERQTAIAALHDGGVRLAWRTGAAPELGFFLLTAEGGSARPAPEFRVPRSAEESRTRLLGRHAVGVAPNGSPPQVGVPAFAQVYGDYPHGFEVKVDGGGGGRLLLVRLALLGQIAEGGDAVHAVVERLWPFRGED
jgi:hypothetical protein